MSSLYLFIMEFDWKLVNYGSMMNSMCLFEVNWWIHVNCYALLWWISDGWVIWGSWLGKVNFVRNHVELLMLMMNWLWNYVNCLISCSILNLWVAMELYWYIFVIHWCVIHLWWSCLLSRILWYSIDVYLPIPHIKMWIYVCDLHEINRIMYEG